MKHLFTLLLLGVWFATAAQAPVPVVAPPPATQGLTFLPNKGQWDARARFAADVPGGRLFLTNAGLTYAFVAGLPHHPARTAPETLRACALRVTFLNAAPTPALRGEAPNGDVRNYFHGSDPRRWASKVPGYAGVRYEGIWPGISAAFHQNEHQQLEYDFLLGPHANPNQVALRYAGADKLTLDAAGNLKVQTPLGTLTELAPKAWTTDRAGRRHAVACRYQLAEATVRFALGKYDPALPLTIDPTVIFSTFTGSTADNWGFTATYDLQGNLYSGGIAFGLGFPGTVGAYSPVFNGVTDPFGGALDCDMAFIKYNPTATGPAARVWATYLGGNSSEFPHSIVTNARGELVILGTTSSANFPTTTTAYDRSFNGGPTTSPYSPPPATPGGQPPFVYGPPYDLPNGSDLVLARLSAQGDSLLAATFLGGTDNDGLLSVQSPQPRLCHNYGDYFRGDVLLDAQDNVYLATTTASADFPIANSIGTAYGGGPTDAVVASLTPRLTNLRFSALLGGSAADAAYSLQRDAGGRIFVAGGTTSSNFPVTAGCLQPTLGGNVDGFVVQLSPSGSALNRATYLGTAAYDQAYFLQLDGRGEVYLLGQTLGRIPISPGRYGNPGASQYVQKLSARLDSLRFSTVVGSAPDSINISPTAFLVDQCDRVYISGWGGGENQNSRFGFANASVSGMPITANAVQPSTDGKDFYLAQFGPAMNRLQYATYLGNDGTDSEGDHVDGGTCRFDPRGFVYHAVCSCGSQGSGFPIPPGANTYSSVKGNFNCNNAAFKINFGTVPITTGTDSLVCSLAPPVPLGGRPLGGTWSGPGVSGSPATGFIFIPSPALVGIQTLTYSVVGDSVCGISAPLRLRVSAPPTVSFAPLPQALYCRGRTPTSVSLQAQPAGGTFAGPGIMGNNFDPVAAGPGQHTLRYTYRAPGLNCPVTATRTVQVVDSIIVFVHADTVICDRAAGQPLSASPPGGTWVGPGVSGSTAVGFIFNPFGLSGPQLLTYTAPGAGPCGGLATRTIEVVSTLSATIQPLPQSSVFCATAPPLTLVGSPAGGIFAGPGVRNGNLFDPALAGVGTHSITYTVLPVLGFCPTVATVTATVLQVIQVPQPADTTVCAASTPVRLTASPSGGTWAGPGVSGSATTGYFFTPNVSLLGTQHLSYAAPGANQCGGTTTRNVTVVPMPMASIVPPATTTLCPASPPVPLVGAPAGGTFSGPGLRNGNEFDPVLAGAGQHTLIYRFVSGDGCPATASVVFTVLPLIAVRLPADTVLCVAGSPLPLTAIPSGGVWSGPGVTGTPTGYFFSPGPAGLGSHQLTYAAPGANQCGGTATRTITVQPVPTASIVTPAVTTFCPSSPAITLTASPAGGSFLGPGMSNNDFVPALANVGANVITYVYNAPGLSCPALATITLTVTPTPPLRLPADTILCPGSTARLRLRATPGGGTWAGQGVSGSAATGFEFDAATLPTGSAFLVYTPLPTTCAQPAGFQVSIAGVPPFEPKYTAPRCPDVLAAPRRISFADAAGNAASRWDFGDGSATATGVEVSHTYTQPGTYQPVVTLPYGPGCALQKALPPVVVKPLNLPNIITPNGDGQNDAFKPTFACLPHLKIYSRWGQLIFESQNYANDWAAQGQTAGTYYFTLEDGTGQEQHGWVEVMK